MKVHDFLRSHNNNQKKKKTVNARDSEAMKVHLNFTQVRRLASKYVRKVAHADMFVCFGYMGISVMVCR